MANGYAGTAKKLAKEKLGRRREKLCGGREAQPAFDECDLVSSLVSNITLKLVSWWMHAGSNTITCSSPFMVLKQEFLTRLFNNEQVIVVLKHFIYMRVSVEQQKAVSSIFFIVGRVRHWKKNQMGTHPVCDD